MVRPHSVSVRAFLILCFALTGFGQLNQSALTGTVTDPEGGRVPDAVVRATQVTTGLVRETNSTPQGNYFLGNLPLGVYTITFTKAGFAAFTVERVRQVVGETRTINAMLGIATGSQQTSITDPLVQLDKVSATVGAPIERAQLNELPLNGRNWSSLTALSPGAIDNGPSDQRTIRFAGHGLDDNNLTIDGVDATAIYNQEQREYVRLTVPLDSIEEFRVQSQNFGADVEGGTAGGQVAVSSPSGTNTFHGDAFDYFRNDALNARSPFDKSSSDPFLLNQFGAGIGGPISHDKTFFYLNYEGLRQRLDQTQIGLVPSPSFISQAESLSPALTPLLSAYPRGTSATTNPNVWNYTTPGRQIDNEDSGMVRIDQRFNGRTTAFVRFNADNAKDAIPTGALNVLSAANTEFRNGIVEVLHVFSSSLVNEAKLGINQEIYHSANVSSSPYTINVSGPTGGFSSLAGNSTTDAAAKTFDLPDDLSWTRGKHTLKVGFEIRWIQMNQGNSQSGTLIYNSLNSFLSNQAGNATYTANLPLKRLRKTQYWGYAQDEWKTTPNFTITMGVRYNFFNVFHEVDHRAIPFDLATCGGYCSPYASFTHPRYNDIDPRIGIAWAHGDTVLRAGGGIYHTDGQQDDQNLPISNDVSRYSFSSTSFPGLSFPLTPFLASAMNAGKGVVSPRDLDRNRKDEYVAAWTASIQQKLPWNIVGTATYLGNKGTDVLTTTYTNLTNPVTGIVPYLAFGPVSWRGNVGNSTFEGLQFNVRRAFQNGWLLSANYMWSHSINDGSIGGGESDTPQDSFCRSCDKASSDDDVRQVFHLSTVYQLPFGPGKRYLTNPGILRAVLGGWELSSIGTWQTGLPVNVTIDRSNSVVPGLFNISAEERPNLVPGVSLTPTGAQTPNDWINASAFSIPAAGTFGNAGRNLVRAPRIWQVDTGLSKSISMTERASIRLRAEMFNLFNRAQYGAPNADLSIGNFGMITVPLNTGATGRGTPREFQLSLKVVF